MVPNSNCNNEKRVYMDEENQFENEVRPCEDIDRDPTVAKVCQYFMIFVASFSKTFESFRNRKVNSKTLIYRFYCGDPSKSIKTTKSESERASSLVRLVLHHILLIKAMQLIFDVVCWKCVN